MNFRVLDNWWPYLYNRRMKSFHFSIPIQVRYGDLDPQWHVNNARFLAYIEQARFDYLVHLGLFDGRSFFDIGLIVADVHIAYRAPIEIGREMLVRIRTARIGTKSLTFAYRIEEAQTGVLCAEAETVMVAYDYHAHASVPVSEEWRAKITAFENEDLS